ncbi:hypothetical protein [Thermodesulfobacterium hveragerdense]|uniref:hypothetical protein n=1 Tax=Thermodesulfobacterium hveragerdense TaxID=53424 RepID=UPI0003FC5F35|nr:hypothetical protein [Thermodesulfobacterium hveragerdense]
MKKFLFILSFVLVSNFGWAEDNQSNKTSGSNSKKCEKVCVKWEERRDCRPDPVFPDRQICALYKVCAQYEEKCN